jgi:hypothetical protein
MDLWTHIGKLVDSNQVPTSAHVPAPAKPMFQRLSFSELVELAVTWGFRSLADYCFLNTSKGLRNRLWAHLQQAPWSAEERVRLIAHDGVPRTKKTMPRRVPMFQLAVHPKIQFTDLSRMVHNRHNNGYIRTRKAVSPPHTVKKVTVADDPQTALQGLLDAFLSSAGVLTPMLMHPPSPRPAPPVRVTTHPSPSGRYFGCTGSRFSNCAGGPKPASVRCGPSCSRTASCGWRRARRNCPRSSRSS